MFLENNKDKKINKIGKSLLFPHIIILCLLFPIGAVLLIYTMLTLEETDPIRIGSYILAFYILVIWCARIPDLICFLKRLRSDNRYVHRWITDVRLRLNVTLIGNTLWNGIYAVLQLGLGIYHRSPWFYFLAAYYCWLALIRFFIVRYTLRHEPGEKMEEELKHYRTCGWVFLAINLALTGMMFYMIHENREVFHHEITTIALAAYTFTSLTMAIINIIKYRKYNSPAVSASKAIALAAACVSMLTLENTMLTTFDHGEMTAQVRRLFLSFSGGAISIFIIVMAIYMIVRGDKKLKAMKV